MTIKAALWMIAAGMLACLGFGAFTLIDGRYSARRSRCKTLTAPVDSNITFMSERRK